MRVADFSLNLIFRKGLDLAGKEKWVCTRILQHSIYAVRLPATGPIDWDAEVLFDKATMFDCCMAGDRDDRVG